MNNDTLSVKSNTSHINISELDFDHIKQNLIDYLHSQDEFSEYDFEGAAFNVLIDSLAYNTFMNAYMANMMANEMFLDSASIRESVISKAKEIGYTARSCRSSKALIRVNIHNVAGSPANILMKSGTLFSTQSNNIFATKKDYLLYPSDTDATTYTVDNVEIYDGNYVEYHYTVNDSDPDQRFIIPSTTVDISTLRVFVQPDISSSEIEEYFLNDDLTKLKPDSKVYFVNEISNGQYLVTFGDGILGKKVLNGNYITFTYIVSSKREDANFENNFIPIEDISGYGDYSIDTIEPSYGGSEKETIESIKLLAPRAFQSQRRAVSTSDYEYFLLNEYPWIDSLNIWGGEKNNPPIYGKVFFAIKPKNTQFVSPTLKKEIKDGLITKYNVLTIMPEVVDPDYIYINVNSDVYYQRENTVNTETYLINQTIDTIYKYFDDTTKKFKMDFLLSPLTTLIDNTDKSFVSSITRITLQKRVFPDVNEQQTFTLDFNNELVPNTIESSYFDIEDSTYKGVRIESVIKDNGKGKLSLISTTNDIVINDDIGSVDYQQGIVTFTITPFNIPLDTLDIRMYANPVSDNIKSGFNQIIVPDDSPVNYSVNRKQGVTVNIYNFELNKG